MGILSGIISFLFGLAVNLLDAAIDGFLGALGFDLDTFETYFPAARYYHDVIIGFAVGLLFIMLIFQIFRNFGIILDMEAEDPLKMLGKTLLFFGMIMYSRSITNIIIGLLVDPYAIFTNAAPRPYEFRLMTLVTSMFTSVFANPFTALLSLILLLILGWNFLKLVIECVERYIVFYFVISFAPVVFATGPFKSTEQIFKSWCRMLASQSLLLLLNVWSIRLFLSFLPVFEHSRGNIIFNFLIGYAFLRFAQKADTLLRILGLNTARTGEMMRSFGGTVAGIVLTVKTLGKAAGAIGTAAGKAIGGGAAAATAGAAAGGAAGGNAVSGMAGAPGAVPTGASADTGNPAADGSGGSATVSNMSSAKQSYVNDVLRSAQNQMGGASDGASPTGDSGFRYEEDGDTGSLRNNAGGKQGGGEQSASDSNIGMDRGASQGGGGNRSRIDPDTREGLANIAHGLPHNKYDPVKRAFSGGGFGEFTGKDANMIGASQLTPADGFEQHGVKMRDGSVGTLYQNAQTGEAHLVQFGSVDNGVIQGTISELDKDTGKFGDFMAFKAVHQSVPGAQSQTSHSVPVADSEGGAYHVSTGASTSFFAPGVGSPMSKAAPSARPSGGPAPRGAPASGSGVPVPPPSSGGIGDSSTLHTSVSSHEASTIHTSKMQASDSPGGPSAKKENDEPRRFSKNNPEHLEVFSRESSGMESFGRASASPEIPKMDPPNDNK